MTCICTDPVNAPMLDCPAHRMRARMRPFIEQYRCKGQHTGCPACMTYYLQRDMVERWNRWEARDVVALADRYQDDAPRLLPYKP